MGKNDFKNWLSKNGYADNTSNSYAYAIDKISKHISTERNENIDIYKIKEMSFLKKIEELYSTIGKYANIGYEGNGTVRNAIKAFYKFQMESNSPLTSEFMESAEDNFNINVDFENLTNFSYERDLKNSMVSQIRELFPGYKIFGEKNEGVEYLIEGKRIDILLEKDDESLLAIELKSGLANYSVFGQISMYLGLLMERFPNKIIRGCIVAGEIDKTLQSATKTSELISLMTYKMKLELKKQ